MIAYKLQWINYPSMRKNRSEFYVTEEEFKRRIKSNNFVICGETESSIIYGRKDFETGLRLKATEINIQGHK